ncbi:ABC transporter permease [Ruminococcus flavefaciens]|uniref:ABC transporter permease n=1 Tax=Ruminococcus flavefaciens TaxID=1265 RepID=UPI00048BA301|nr:ABC transporter permease [Ruminococcus flavefaciens]
MIPKIKLRHKIIAAVNAVAVAGAIILTAVGSSAAKAQRYNYASERWRNGSKSNYGQVSCYFSKEAGFTTKGVEEINIDFYNQLAKASITREDNQKLVAFAYSTLVGSATLSCDRSGISETDITAVGGDFFLFRQFRLRKGAFFKDDDLMKNGAVIDRQVAWNLYGSDDIIGKNIYVNNVKLFVMGVIDLPDTKAEEKCIGKTPKAYITYDAAELIFGENSGEGGSSKLTRVTCCEFISPDPVENFTYTVVKKHFEKKYDGELSIVNNKTRFEPKTRVKALKNIEDLVVGKGSVVYPYWENASRITDIRLSFIYGGRRLLLLIPIITLAVLLIKAFKLYNRKKAGLKKAFADYVSVKWSKLTSKKAKTVLQTTEKES